MPMMTWAPEQEVQRERMPLLKKLFWAYFLLLFFEGALRKWIVPELSLPLLLVRDPIAIAILWEAYRTRRWPREWAEIIGVFTLSLLCLSVLQMIVLGFPWYIALYGLRSYVLPFPVAFVMGTNLDREDLRKFARFTLWLALPLTALQVAQYYAAPDSFLNKGAYAGATQITYALGHVRASSTFSFVTGPAHYLPLIAGFILFGVVKRDFIRPRVLIWLSAAALLIAIPVTGSRTVVYEMCALFVLFVLTAFSGVSEVKGAVKTLLVVAVIAAMVVQLPVLSDSMDTLTKRFSQASISEGDTESTMKSRAVVPVLDSLDSALTSNNWLGQGLGYGSNFASHALMGSAGYFLAGETEWQRVIVEFGPFFGIAFMLFRVLFALYLASRAFSGVREHQPLAWFLMAATLPGLVFEILEQPTIQGFVVVTIAFVLAALDRSNFEPESLGSEPIYVRQFEAGAQ